jgi:hypothetical protein
MLLRKPLTVNQLHQQRERRAVINHDTYKKLYHICTTVIEGLQHIRPPVTCCSWTVPEHIMWRPPYRREHAVRYVRDKLEHYGFAVCVRDEFTLDISWDVTKKKVKTTKKKRKKKNVQKVNSLVEMAARAERMTGRLRTA